MRTIEINSVAFTLCYPPRARLLALVKASEVDPSVSIGLQLGACITSPSLKTEYPARDRDTGVRPLGLLCDYGEDVEEEVIKLVGGFDNLTLIVDATTEIIVAGREDRKND